MRFNRLRRVTLEGLLGLGFGSLIAGGVLAAILAISAWRLADTGFDEYEKQDAPIAVHASKGVDAWLKIRNREQRFVLSVGNDVRPADAKAQYIPLWKSGVDDLQAALLQIRRLADKTDERVVAVIPGIESALSLYVTSFTAIADLVVRLGDAETGLDGEMRAKARAAEALISEMKFPAMTQSLQRLNRSREDFAATGKEHYFKEFLDESIRAESFDIRAPQTHDVRATLRDYAELFGKYVKVSGDLETKKRESAQAVALLEPGLEQLEHEALENTHEMLLALERRIVAVTLCSALVAVLAVMLGSVVAWFASDRIRLATRRIIGFAIHVAAGRLDTRLDRVDVGELGALESALNTMADRLQENDEVMNKQAHGLEASNRRIALLSEMTTLLQTAVGAGEAAVISARHLSRMRLGRGGLLYIYNESHDHLDAIARWGDATSSSDSFFTADCWGLRRGQPYESSEAASPLVCAHVVSGTAPPSYLCLPLATSMGILGLVYVDFDDTESIGHAEDRHFAHRLSEQLGLAFANLKLRETLRQQTLCDPLTTLFNRRFLEESMPRECARASREKLPLALLMIDADHFKAFNDNHGHEAGDAALRQLALVLRENCRANDLACRFGGEEFTVLLPATGREGAQAWSARLLDKVREMTVTLNGTPLPRITVSIGIAIYPNEGVDASTLLQAADRALYEAKEAGRDRVAVASQLKN
jgi:diguanylate cyclase (GGDEF)-like protein